MAHFAQIDENNVVVNVTKIENTLIQDGDLIEQESIGVEYLQRLFGGRWVQTSYNNNFRKCFAGIGFYYNEDLDVFVPPKPFDSWLILYYQHR